MSQILCQSGFRNKETIASRRAGLGSGPDGHQVKKSVGGETGGEIAELEENSSTIRFPAGAIA